MSLELDERQKAMLQEMGIRVWEPEVETASVAPVLVPAHAQAPVSERPQPATALKAPLTRTLEPTSIPDDAASLGWKDLEALAPAGVLGEGNRNADWMFVIEASTQNDPQGDPFTGQGARLFDGMLRAAGLSRAAVFVVCAIKSQLDAPDAANSLLRRQVELVKPKVIVAMGRFAAQALCDRPNDKAGADLAQLPLGKMRGLAHPYRLNETEASLIVTYAPSALARIPADKAKAWADLCLALVTVESR